MLESECMVQSHKANHSPKACISNLVDVHTSHPAADRWRNQVYRLSWLLLFYLNPENTTVIIIIIIAANPPNFGGYGSLATCVTHISHSFEGAAVLKPGNSSHSGYNATQQ